MYAAHVIGGIGHRNRVVFPVRQHMDGDEVDDVGQLAVARRVVGPGDPPQADLAADGVHRGQPDSLGGAAGRFGARFRRAAFFAAVFRVVFFFAMVSPLDQT